MIGRYQPGEAYLAAQGRVFVVLYGYGQAANWPELEEGARQAITTYRYAPYGSGLYPCPPKLAARAAGGWGLGTGAWRLGGSTNPQPLIPNC
jgi:hypothetical protein